MTTIDMNTSRAFPQGRLCFYHPTRAGNGSAVRWELKLPSVNGRGGCVYAELANQAGPASPAEGNARVFDWEKKGTVKLGFLDLCEIVSVLEGQAQSAGSHRNGLYHQSGGHNTMIRFEHGEKGGFLFGISRRDKAGNTVFRGHVILSPVESIGLRCALQQALFHLAFHGAAEVMESAS